MNTYTHVVIGFGKAGKTLAATLAKQGERVALIDISGVIADTGGYGGSGDPRTIVGFLRQAETDPRVKAVVVRINSGGGMAAAIHSATNATPKLRA